MTSSDCLRHKTPSGETDTAHKFAFDYYEKIAINPLPSDE